MTIDKLKNDMWNNSESARLMIEYNMACNYLEEAYKAGASDMEAAKNIAIDGLLKQIDKYKWHDLRKDPEDLPEFETIKRWEDPEYPGAYIKESGEYLVIDSDGDMYFATCEKWVNEKNEYYFDHEKYTFWDTLPGAGIAPPRDGMSGRDIIAWKHIEPFAF